MFYICLFLASYTLKTVFFLSTSPKQNPTGKAHLLPNLLPMMLCGNEQPLASILITLCESLKVAGRTGSCCQQALPMHNKAQEGGRLFLFPLSERPPNCSCAASRKADSPVALEAFVLLSNTVLIAGLVHQREHTGLLLVLGSHLPQGSALEAL